MAEGRGFAPVQLYGLASAFQTGTLLDSVNPPQMGDGWDFHLFGAGRQAALFDLLERGKRISLSPQPWEGRMF